MLDDNEIEFEELVIDKEKTEPKPDKKPETRMNKTDEVENISVNVDANILSVEVNLDNEIGTTKRGKISIATTHGSKHYQLNDDYGCFLSLTVYKN